MPPMSLCQCSANSQKDAIKQDKNALIWGKEPVYVEGRLLVSGLWGVVRKPNYLGDLLMAYAYGLPAGLSGGFFAYTYATYLTLLLWHRASRDEHRCSQKYGEIWDRYVEVVPERLVPYVY